MENTELITKAIRYIHQTTEKSDISISDVADHAGFSHDYFNRIFSLHTGFSVMEYIRFSRLKKAALLLRTTDRDVLDIALDCGYEAHESFSRAFRRQYDRSPSEYRAYHAGLPLRYADVTEEATSTRFLHEFPGFCPVENGLLTDELLERNARRFGISAAELFDYNGTRFFTDSEHSVVGIDEFQKGVFYATILADSLDEAARLIKLLDNFAQYISFGSNADDQEILAAMHRQGMTGKTGVDRVVQYLYAGDLLPTGQEVRPLEAADLPAVRSWALDYGSDWKLEETLTQRDIYHNDLIDLPFGVFADGTLIAVCRSCVYALKGFRVGEIEGIAALPQYRSGAFAREVYAAVINALLERGYPPCFMANPAQSAGEMDIDAQGFPFEAVYTSCQIR